MNCGHCNKKGVDVAHVKACATSIVRTVPLATEKQRNFIKSLASEVVKLTFTEGVVPEKSWETADEYESFILNELDGLTKQDASGYINNLVTMRDNLKERARAARFQWNAGDTQEVLEDGIYVLDDEIYKVVHAVHGSGQQYAKRLKVVDKGDRKKISWDYAGKRPLHSLTSAHRMTAEHAKQFGQLYGMCVNCSRTLTREESIHVGYGATCASNNGWWYPTKSELAELTG